MEGGWDGPATEPLLAAGGLAEVQVATTGGEAPAGVHHVFDGKHGDACRILDCPRHNLPLPQKALGKVAQHLVAAALV